MTDKQNARIANLIMFLVCCALFSSFVLLSIKHSRPAADDEGILLLEKPLEQQEIDNFKQQKK